MTSLSDDNNCLDFYFLQHKYAECMGLETKHKNDDEQHRGNKSRSNSFKDNQKPSKNNVWK